MKKTITRLGVLIFMTMALAFVPVQMKDVKAERVVNVHLFEGEEYLGELSNAVAIHGVLNSWGTVSTNTTTTYDAQYAKIRTVSNAFFFTAKAGSFNFKNSWPLYAIQLKDTVTNEIIKYNFFVSETPDDIKFTDSYIDKNNTIYMYEGDTLTSSFTGYTKGAVTRYLDQGWIAHKISEPGYDGITVTTNGDVTEKNKFTITAVKEGEYHFYAKLHSNQTGKNSASWVDGKLVTTQSPSFSETIKVKVLKKPTITLEEEVYMNINSQRTLICGIDNISENGNSKVVWNYEPTALITDNENGVANTITSYGGTTDSKGIVITATYTDEVINNNPNHKPIVLSCTLHIVDEKMFVVGTDGTDLLANGAVLTGSSMSTIINCNTEYDKISVKSENEAVAKVALNGNKLTISRVSTGTTNVILTTITGTEYKIPVKVKADAPIVKADAANAKISWSKAFGAKSYDVYRSNSVNGLYTKIGNVNGLTCTDVNAEYGTIYYYKVVSVAADNSCSSGYSNIVSCKRIPATPSVSSITEKNGLFMIKISGVAKCDGYEVYTGTSSSPSKLAASTNITEATVSIGKGTWYVRIRAYVTVNGQKIYSNYSNVCSFSKKTTVAVYDNNGKQVTVGKAKIKKATRSGSKIKLKLKKVSGAKGYQIKYATSKKFKKAKTKTSNKTTATLKKIKTKKVYYVKVRAYKIVNNTKVYGKWSKVKKVKVSKKK